MTNAEWLAMKLRWVRPACLPVSLLAVWWFRRLSETSFWLFPTALLFTFTSLVWIGHFVELFAEWLGKERGR